MNGDEIIGAGAGISGEAGAETGGPCAENSLQKLRQSASERLPEYENCRLCPRGCGVNRYERTGFCGMGAELRVARAALHFWEEPCISGKRGSGAVFFSGCVLRCCYCQNYEISSGGFGRELSVRQLADVFLRLADEGAENINLVTPTQFLPGILRALDLIRHRLSVPVVLNCGGYERAETIRGLRGYVDIYLPDLKYKSSALSRAYSGAADYFPRAMEAIAEMVDQCGTADADVPPEGETLRRGVIVRHMVLPSCRKDSIALLQEMDRSLPKHRYLLSLMSQYTPCYRAKTLKELNRRLTSYEYGTVLREAQRLAFRGYMQEKSSAKEEYTPPFDLTGLPG